MEEKKPSIKENHFRDMVGTLLWKEPMQLSRLYGKGDIITDKGVTYTVFRVAVADEVQHINIIKTRL
jgi:hypothetical protein